MIRSRRSMLIVGAAGVAASVAETFAKADAFQSPQYRPSPNAPTNPNAPAGMNGPEIIHPDKNTPGNFNQMQIVGMVHQLV